MFRKRKAQVTIFIIIGLIILLTVGVIYYMKTRVTEARVEIALKQDTAEGDAVIVQKYVGACLDAVAKRGLLLLGQHGGFINLSRTDVHNQEFQVNEADATASDAIVFHGLEIPYWWYEDSSHGCASCSITTKNIPTMDSMEMQVGVYIQENLDACLDNFTALEEYGFTVTAEKAPAVESDSGNHAVYVQLQYPLTITKEGTTTRLENWYVQMDVPLEEIYNAAVEIVSMEIKNQFLEQITLNVISAYAGLDEERLPPITGFTEGYAIIYWVKQNVKEQVGKYMRTYIPLIQIQGTAGAEKLEPATSYGKGFYTLLFRESSYSFGNLNVDFIAPTTEDADYYLDITPSAGELLKPTSYKNEFPLNILPPVQTNHYAFYYDISYPVVVSVQDSNAFDGEGYTFFFGLEDNLRNNRNMMEWAQGTGTYGPWDAAKVSIGLKEGVPTTYPTGFNTATNQTIYATYEEPEKTLICDAAQRISGKISVGVYNGVTGEPIPDAAVSFRCGTYETCTMGAADTGGAYEDRFPICVGGAVRIDAEGYYTQYINLDTTPEKEENIIALLEPVKEIPVTIEFIPATRANESLSADALRNLAFDMSRTDSVLLTVEKAQKQLFESPYSQVVTITKEEPANISLVSGTYTVSALLMDEKGVIIPARNDTVSGQLIEYPEVNMTPALLGQVTLDETTGQWIVDSSALQRAQGVTFYLFRINDPHYIEDLSALGDLDNYSLMYREVVEPKWS